MITFPTKRSAIRFMLGYCDPRVVVQLGRQKFGICTPATAKRNGYKVIERGLS